MRVLTVPNWSFGRCRDLFHRFQETVAERDVTVHYLQGDPDHNRTVSAFSGTVENVEDTLFALADLAMPAIDLQRHTGVHPRIGALDVCPFLPLSRLESQKERRLFREWIEGVAGRLADRYEIPVFLYEKSEQGRHESDLPTLRKGGFGGMIGRQLNPDFGPAHAHERLGATVMGWRDFLIAMNSNLREPTGSVARDIARRIRARRSEGDPRFLGVRSLGFLLASQNLSQVSLNLTLPDLAPADPVLEWIAETASGLGTELVHNELIGVIRDTDLPRATRLHPRPEQIVSVPS